MEIINLAIFYTRDFLATSEATYHVNPWIFGILFFGSGLPLFYGYYRIGKSAIKFEDRKFHKKEVDTQGLKIGIAFSIIAWWIPYVYVIFFGKLPLNIWIYFIFFIIIMGLIFLRTLLSKISKAIRE